MKKFLLETTATRRTDLVSIDGNKIQIQELSTDEFLKYREIADKEGKEKGNAFLIASCVLEDGATCLDEAESLQIARNARVSIRLVGGILKLSGFTNDEEEGTEKHAPAS